MRKNGTGMCWGPWRHWRRRSVQIFRSQPPCFWRRWQDMFHAADMALTVLQGNSGSDGGNSENDAAADILKYVRQG